MQTVRLWRYVPEHVLFSGLLTAEHFTDTQFGSWLHSSICQQCHSWYITSRDQRASTVSKGYAKNLFGQYRGTDQSSRTGLLTNVGMVVANAAYDSNTTNIKVFDNTAYHGAVVW
jgi:hypothetical protein